MKVGPGKVLLSIVLYINTTSLKCGAHIRAIYEKFYM